MTRVAALGEGLRVRGFGLAGAVVVVAETPESVRRAWAGLEDGVEVVLLTPAAASALGEGVKRRSGLLVAVMTE